MWVNREGEQERVEWGWDMVPDGVSGLGLEGGRIAAPVCRISTHTDQHECAQVLSLAQVRGNSFVCHGLSCLYNRS